MKAKYPTCSTGVNLMLFCHIKQECLIYNWSINLVAGELVSFSMEQNYNRSITPT